MSCCHGPPKTLHVYIEVFMVNNPVFQKVAKTKTLYSAHGLLGGKNGGMVHFFPEAKASEGSVIDPWPTLKN